MTARPLRRPPRAFAALALAALVASTGVGCRRRHLAARGDGSAVVVVEPRPGDESGVASGPEQEPNNTVAAAQLLTLAGDPLAIAVTGSLSGSGKSADVDVFKLVVPGGADIGSPESPATGGPIIPPATGAGGAPPAPPPESAPPVAAARRLMVELQPEEGLAPILQLLDAAGRPVLTTSAAAGERDGLPNLAVAPGGTYFLRLRALERGRGAPDAGPGRTGYRLVARVVDFDLGDEREPNDRAVQATELGGAHTSPEVAGFFGWRRDEDWYRLPVDGLPAGSVLDLEVDAVEGVTPTLALHDQTGGRISIARGRRGERISLRNAAIPSAAALPPAGKDGGAAGRAVYVVVRAEAGRNLDHRYTLRVRAGLAKEGTETEPNDDPAHASPLADGLTTGFLGPGDVDVFRYAPSLGVVVDLEAMPPAGVNLKLEVLRESDRQTVASADSGGRRQPERLGNISVTEPVLIRLTQRRGEGNSDEPYQLRVTSKPRPEGEPAPGPTP